MYCLQTILPEPRQVRYIGGGKIEILNENDVIEADDNFIAVYDKNGAIDNMPLKATGARFGFEYSPRLTFLHCKDLRNIPYWGLDTESNLEIAGDELGGLIDRGHINSLLDIRHIGVVGNSGIDVGYGVYAADDIKAGTFLGEYVGVVMQTPPDSSSCYALNYPCKVGGYVIDSNDTGNIIRMINHSDNYNSSFRSVLHDSLIHVICVSPHDMHVCSRIFVASSLIVNFAIKVSKRDIIKNEQVTVDYGEGYWISKSIKPLSFADLSVRPSYDTNLQR